MSPKPSLIISYKNYSSWSLKPWILIKHYQLDCDEKREALFTETTNEELTQHSSSFTRPIINTDNPENWDSFSILEYISELYFDLRGWPANVEAFAAARSIRREMHSNDFDIQNDLLTTYRETLNNIKLPLSAKQDIERIKSLWRLCRHEYSNNGDWIFGDHAIGDAMFAPVALHFHGYNIPLSTVDKFYVKNVFNQPGIVEWLEGKLGSDHSTVGRLECLP